MPSGFQRAHNYYLQQELCVLLKQMFKLFFESWHSGDIFKTGTCFKLYLLEISEQNHKRIKIILCTSISNSPFYKIGLMDFNETLVYITTTN